MLDDQWLTYHGPAITDKWGIHYYPAQWQESMFPPEGAMVLDGGVSSWEVTEFDRGPVLMASWMSCSEALQRNNMNPGRKAILYKAMRRLPLECLKERALTRNEDLMHELLAYTEENARKRKAAAAAFHIDHDKHKISLTGNTNHHHHHHHSAWERAAHHTIFDLISH